MQKVVGASPSSTDASGNNQLVKFFDGPFPLDYAHCAPRVPSNTPLSLFGSNIQTGIITVLNSGQTKVLELWEKQFRGGHIKKMQDTPGGGTILEITGTNPLTNFITCPIGLHQSLGIRLPNLILTVKNVRKPFMFDVMIQDDRNLRRRLRFSNRQSTTRIKPFLSYIPIRMEDGWNIIQLDLQEITFKSFGSNFKEAVRVQLYANCRLRRVAFAENLTEVEDIMPADVKAFLTVPGLTKSNALLLG